MSFWIMWNNKIPHCEIQLRSITYKDRIGADDAVTAASTVHASHGLQSNATWPGITFGHGWLCLSQVSGTDTVVLFHSVKSKQLESLVTVIRNGPYNISTTLFTLNPTNHFQVNGKKADHRLFTENKMFSPQSHLIKGSTN